MNTRQLFLQHLAQTSPAPIALQPATAQGIYIYDAQQKAYIDGISGFSVANIGHSNAAVIQAVNQQVQSYMHLIVYGEFIQQPQVAYAQMLTQHLPQQLNCVYFTNSGTEATEGALKLAKRHTNRSKIFSFNKAYHGSTQGALSVMGGEYFKNAFRPLLPQCYQFNYNEPEVLLAINETVAAVIVEPIQAEAGVLPAQAKWLQQLREKCTQYGVLLIFDEIQSGFGRSGSLWAFEQYNVIPDVLLLGKALGGGMPLGAFIASHQLMQQLTYNPVLGHITTFGGHPVSCAAGQAAMQQLLQHNYIADVASKGLFLKNLLHHTAIKNINQIGLWLAVQFESADIAIKISHTCVKNGLITDWFLFNDHCIRIAPPLIITQQQLQQVANIILQSIEEVVG